jgi:hypothetical protein
VLKHTYVFFGLRSNCSSYAPQLALLAARFVLGFFLGLFFDPEDGGSVFLRNGGWLSSDYTALYQRR